MAPKVEPLSALDEQILQVLDEHPEGLVDDDLGKHLEGVTAEARVEAINKLLAVHRLSLSRTADGSTFYIGITAEEAQKFKGFTQDDHLVYQSIKGAGNTGIWVKDLRYKTGLQQQQQVNKILRNLEQRSLIKSVKSVMHASRKLYMLYELQPATEVTGGAWYNNQNFDKEYVDVLQKLTYRYIQDFPESSLEDIADFLQEKQVSNEVLEPKHVAEIVRTLDLEGKIEIVERDEIEVFRPALLTIPETNAFTSVPCGVCPVISECTPNGPISPGTCVYFQKWLDF